MGRWGNFTIAFLRRPRRWHRFTKFWAKCVKKTPKGTWISGGYWASDFFKHYRLGSPRKWLDEISGERPIILRDDTGHNVWANSAALRRAAIDSNTADPTGGRFEREANSRKPDGIAFEAAAEKIQAAVAARTRTAISAESLIRPRDWRIDLA